MGTAIASGTGTSANSFDADYPIAAAINASSSAADWIARLALPAVQTAALLPILNYQSQKYDDIERQKVRYLDDAYESWCECICQTLEWVQLATDDIPEPAVFQPVQPAGQQIETIASNEEALHYTARFLALLNKHQREADLARAIALNPKYYEFRDLKCDYLGNLIKGEMSTGKLLNITTDVAQNSVINGRFGLVKKQTARNIGIEQEELKQRAMREMRLEDSNNNQNIHPIARQAMMEGYMLKPQDALVFALQQAQLMQNSLQNENNAYAKKAPYLAKQADLMLTKCLNALQIGAAKAGVVNSFVPNYASIFQRQIQDFSTGLFDGVSSGIFGGPTSAQINQQQRFGGVL